MTVHYLDSSVPAPLAVFGEHPSHGEIAARAFDLYEARGAQPGYDLQDWLEAERQLLQEYGESVGRLHDDD
jgi:hypothetical protein